MSTGTQTRLSESIARLKGSIRASVVSALDQFEGETGITPTGIEIKMIETTCHGDPFANRRAVDVEIDLGSY